MRHPKTRTFTALGIAAVWGLLSLSAGPAAAQAFPSKPLKFVLPYPGGSTSDTVYRPVAEQMGKILGQNVIIDYRPGAATVLAAKFVRSQPPDGYTFSIGSNTLVLKSLVPKEEIDVRKEFTPIAPAASAPMILAVNSEQVKATNLREFLSEAKARPGQLNYSSYGIGSGAHLFLAVLFNEAKVNLEHIPYQGSAQAISDAAVGRVQATGNILAGFRPHVASLGGSGRLRLLAVSTEERSRAAPDIPGMRESGFPGLDYKLWSAFIGPAGMPRNIVEILNRASNQAYADAAVLELVAKFGQDPGVGTPEDVARTMDREYNAISKLIKDTGLKLE